MTDARFPERWLNDRRFRRLSADEFRTFSMALLWAVANRTDGELLAEDFPYIPDAVPGHAGRLVEVGLWAPAGAGWFIVDFEGTQTSKGQLDGLDARKRQDADRQRAKRDRDRAAASSPGPHVMESRDGHVTESRDDIGQARTGQDRQGQGSLPVTSETGIAEIAGPESSNVSEPSSTDLGFCGVCGVELDEWGRGTVAGRCLACSDGQGPDEGAGSVAGSDPGRPDPGPDGCLDCGGELTEYFRTHGGRCFPCAAEYVRASRAG